MQLIHNRAHELLLPIKQFQPWALSWLIRRRGDRPVAVTGTAANNKSVR